jgi:5-(carboxyamino)imidazole ribonucleotide synthase
MLTIKKPETKEHYLLDTTYPTQTQEEAIIHATRIGIIGGGQLGLMLSEAACAMGFAGVTVLDPTPQCPAASVAEQIVGSLKDPQSLRLLAERSDILTYEIEHINAEALQALLAEGINSKICPAPDLLTIIQNKYRQKEFLARHNIPVAPFLAIASRADLEHAIHIWGYPLVLKAKKDAYDGRGNARINQAEDIEAALEKLGDRELYVEQCIDLEKELGLMTARNARGESVSHPVVEMIHVRDICQTVIAPAPIAEEQRDQAQVIARQAIDALSGIGIFGVELFLDKAGKIWLNEIAPRPHNLGHYTIEACQTSQYVQHLRAVTNLRLTSTAMLYPVSVMENILGTRDGSAEPRWVHDYDHEHVFVHLYGKREAKIDRKMGHVTVVGDNLDRVYQQAKEARAALSI